MRHKRCYEPVLDGYDGPVCSVCGEPADYVEKSEGRVNYHGYAVGYWALECSNPECKHVERIRNEGIMV